VSCSLQNCDCGINLRTFIYLCALILNALFRRLVKFQKSHEWLVRKWIFLHWMKEQVWLGVPWTMFLSLFRKLFVWKSYLLLSPSLLIGPELQIRILSYEKMSLRHHINIANIITELYNTAVQIKKKNWLILM
jgi:hypothetical protein